MPHLPHPSEVNRLHDRNFRQPRESVVAACVAVSRCGAGQQMAQAWNVTRTRSGAAVSCVNASCNGTAADGSSVSFGFNASWSGSNPVPTVTRG